MIKSNILATSGKSNILATFGDPSIVTLREKMIVEKRNEYFELSVTHKILDTKLRSLKKEHILYPNDIKLQTNSIYSILKHELLMEQRYLQLNKCFEDLVALTKDQKQIFNSTINNQKTTIVVPIAPKQKQTIKKPHN